MFLEDCPFDGPVPRHLDPLVGSPCPGAGLPTHGVLEIPDHPHRPGGDWPAWRDWDKMRRRP